ALQQKTPGLAIAVMVECVPSTIARFAEAAEVFTEALLEVFGLMNFLTEAGQALRDRGDGTSSVFFAAGEHVTALYNARLQAARIAGEPCAQIIASLPAVRRGALAACTARWTALQHKLASDPDAELPNG